MPYRADGLGSVCATSFGLGKREEADYRRHSQGVNDEGTEVGDMSYLELSGWLGYSWPLSDRASHSQYHTP